MKKLRLTENELVRLIKGVISEQGIAAVPGEQKENKKKEPPKPRCMEENMIPLDEMVGQADEYVKYSPGVTKRRMGVNSMVDTSIVSLDSACAFSTSANSFASDSLVNTFTTSLLQLFFSTSTCEVTTYTFFIINLRLKNR